MIRLSGGNDKMDTEGGVVWTGIWGDFFDGQYGGRGWNFGGLYWGWGVSWSSWQILNCLLSVSE